MTTQSFHILPILDLQQLHNGFYQYGKTKIQKHTVQREYCKLLSKSLITPSNQLHRSVVRSLSFSLSVIAGDLLLLGGGRLDVF